MNDNGRVTENDFMKNECIPVNHEYPFHDIYG